MYLLCQPNNHSSEGWTKMLFLKDRWVGFEYTPQLLHEEKASV